MEQKYRKIHIIGEVGSGKTYLARKLSELLSIPFHQLDNVVWNRTGEQNTRNAPEVRDEKLNAILQSEGWIIEGAHYKWVSQSFELSDVIIFLNPSVYKRDRQMILRFFKQKMGIEKGNYTQDVGNLIEMLKWNHKFETERYPKINEVLEPFKSKVQHFSDNEDAIKHFKHILRGEISNV